ncbi:unnamed protein product [Effrenium voratum]|uniref:Uncharacterized protein n=1 Tax=Effrenium voratum TaxID=2562239 RepID=A0AA36IBS7_9DINO|nr:unnamed protein product [Effrenium voratum]
MWSGGWKGGWGWDQGGWGGNWGWENGGNWNGNGGWGGKGKNGKGKGDRKKKADRDGDWRGDGSAGKNFTDAKFSEASQETVPLANDVGHVGPKTIGQEAPVADNAEEAPVVAVDEWHQSANAAAWQELE